MIVQTVGGVFLVGWSDSWCCLVIVQTVGGVFLVGGRASWCWLVIVQTVGGVFLVDGSASWFRPHISRRIQTGGRGAKDQCGGAVVLANQSSQDNRRDGISLNINYLDSPTGLQKH